MKFAKRAAEIIQSTSSIVYTDFIKDIGPIVSALEEVGVEAGRLPRGNGCSLET